MMSTVGKDMSPCRKSASSSFEFLRSEDRLCRAGGCYRLVFSYVNVFWKYGGLNSVDHGTLAFW